MTSGPFACRSCGATELHTILSLGSMPLANALLTAEQLGMPELRYPLTLAFCPACTLVQITETVPPEQLFGEYLYFSSFSDTMVAHARTLVERLVPARRLGPDSLAMEIASNDGYLLQFYRERGIPVLGIEPAANIARVAEAARGIPTLQEFFGEAFNFSNETQVTVLELAERILAKMGSRLKPEVRNEATNEILHQYLSAAKARKVLGWRPLFSLDAGLERTIAWYRAFLDGGSNGKAARGARGRRPRRSPAAEPSAR